MKISRTSSARMRAREVLAKREEHLGILFAALDQLEYAKSVIGTTVESILSLGMSKGELKNITGLSIKELNSYIAKSKEQESDESESIDTEVDAQDSSDDDHSQDNFEEHSEG